MFAQSILPWQVSWQGRLLLEGWLLPIKLLLYGMATVGFVTILVLVILFAARDIDR